jgi:hypothetical protein
MRFLEPQKGPNFRRRALEIPSVRCIHEVYSRWRESRSDLDGSSADIFYLPLVLKIDFFGHRCRIRPKHVKPSKLMTKASRPGFACEARPISQEHPELVVATAVDVPAELCLPRLLRATNQRR